MSIPKHVVEHIRSVVVSKKALGLRTDYRSIVNEIRTEFAEELTEDQIWIVQDFKSDLVKVINLWAPALREIRSAVDNVEVPSEPREY